MRLCHKDSEDVQHQLDLQLRALDQKRQKISFERNTHALINRLPQDTLTQIFLEVIGITGKEFVPLISHICSHWRSVALSTPLLWASCFPSHPDGIRTFLERSRNTRLHIDLDNSRMNKIIDLWPHFRSSMWRTHKLSLLFHPVLTGTGIGWEPVLETNLETQSEHHPQSMQLNQGSIALHREVIVDIFDNISPCTESLRIEYLSSTSTMLTLKECLALRRGHAEGSQIHMSFPYLRRICFYNFNFDWGCGILQNLHEMVIVHDRGISDAMMWILLDAIEACPQIQYLELLFPTTGAPLPLRERPSLVPLHCLRGFKLSPAFSGAFLARFSLPVVEHAYIDAKIPARNRRHGAIIMGAISDLLSRHDYPVVELEATLSRFGHSEFPGAFRINSKINTPYTLPGSVQSASGTSELHINFRLDEAPEDIVVTIMDNAIFQVDALSMTKLSCIFPCMCSTPAAFWARIFAKTPHLTTLSMITCSSSTVVEVISALSSISPHDTLELTTGNHSRTTSPGSKVDLSDQPKLLLPVLKELMVKKTVLSLNPLSWVDIQLVANPHLVGYSGMPVLPSREEVSNLIKTCLDTRAQYGYAVEKVHTSFMRSATATVLGL